MPEDIAPSPNPDPAAVAQFLSEEQPENISVQLDEETRAATSGLFDTPGGAANAEETTRVQIPMDPTFDPENPSQLRALLWTMELPSLGKIEVSDTEKVLYLKSLLNDDPVVFEVSIEHLGFQVEMASRTNFEQEAIFQVIKDAIEKKEVIEAGAYITLMQHLCGATMIRKINGKEFGKPITPEENESYLDFGKRLRTRAEVLLNNFNLVKWNTLLMALRIFEAKLKLCADNANNATFWKLAS